MTRQQAPVWLVWAALLVIYVVWGSTYLAIAVVVKTMPPLLAAGIRFVLAGAVMAAVIAIVRGPSSLRIGRRELVGSAIVGLALLLGGNGLVMLAEQTVPSGLTALIIAVEPLWVVLLRVAYAERVRVGTWLGVLVGFGGVVLLMSSGLSGEVHLVGMLMVVVASLTWSIGSFYSSRLPTPADPFVSSAVQMALGGIGLTAVGVLAGELPRLQAGGFAPESVLALAYLVVFGSIVAYSTYTWLLQNAPVSKVMTFAYVNPVVAIFLGLLILAEPVTAVMIVGGAMIIAAVAVVIRAESRPASVEQLTSPTPVAALGGRAKTG